MDALAVSLNGAALLPPSEIPISRPNGSLALRSVALALDLARRAGTRRGGWRSVLNTPAYNRRSTGNRRSRP
jgi:hypothetical protein